MKLRWLAIILVCAVASGILMAHGNKIHVRGTLERVSSDSVVVKTADGKSVEVKLAPSTVYTARSGNEDKPAKQTDLAVGDLVVIHATPKDSILEADTIKFSAGAPKGKTLASPKV
jgi:hypothetical protein